MPGHVKAGKPGAEDPDPAPYLVVTMEMKREDMLKPYDSKKSYWCPDMSGGYTECMLVSDEGGKATVMCGHVVSYIYVAPSSLIYFPLLLSRVALSFFVLIWM